MKKHMLKKALSAAMVATLSVGCMAGCGSNATSGNNSAASTDSSATSTDNSTTSDSSSASSETTSESGLDKVAFISPTPLESYDYLAIYAGMKMGYFEEEGIDLELIEQTGTDDMKMLASGQAQFAYPSPGVMFSCIDAGITNVKAICNYDSIMIFGIAVGKDSGIKTFEDLKGKDVALAAESWSSLLAPILGGAGMTIDDVNLVNFGDGRFEAVGSGSTPALGTWLSEYCQLIGQGYELDYLDGNEVAAQVSNALCTSQEMIDENPELVQRFVNAFTKSMYFCYCNPEAAADCTLLACPNLDIDWNGALGAAEGDVQQIFGISDEDQKATIEAGIGKFDETLCQNAADHLYAAGAIANEYTATDYYTNEFVETLGWDKAEVEADAAAYVCSSPQYTEAH